MLSTHSNEFTAFVVDGSIYRVIATDHAIKQMRVRNLDKYHISSACLALGGKLTSYNNSGKQIMIMDEGKCLSVVVAVENYTVVLITVIDKSKPYVKSNTIIENFSFAG